MKNSSLPLKLFVYFCTWILAFILINIVIAALSILVYGKESISSLGFEKGMILINEYPSGISIQFFFGLTVLVALLTIGYRRYKKTS